VATSGTTTTLVDSTKSWTANQWAGFSVRIFSGTGENQLRRVISNTNTTLTWSSAGTAPDATSRYIIEGFDAGTATSGASTSITDSSKSWTTNRWSNMMVTITAGTGIGQSRSIVSNTSTVLTVTPPWNTNPDSTSTYRIQGDNDKLFIAFGGQSNLFIHNLDSDTMTNARRFDSGLARLGSAQYGSDAPVAITSISRTGTTATVTTVNNHHFRTGNIVTHAEATAQMLHYIIFQPLLLLLVQPPIPIQ